MLRRACIPAAKKLMTGVVLVGATRSLSYVPRTRDFQFLFEEVFDMYSHYTALKYNEEPVTKELMDTMLEECGKMCEQAIFPLYTSGDQEGCVLKDGKVTVPKGYKEAYKTFCDGGWTCINEPEEYGGQNLPPTVGFTTREIVATANWSFGMYPGLSTGAVRTLLTWGSEALKEKYLPKMVSGEWSGTMCLTEPQCGTDLAQVKTRAEDNGDGTYKITGTKIFISAGDHDMADNIIHVVLARLPNSVPTTKGLSLFLVPRHVVAEDGSCAEARNVETSGLEHKMGIKASSTCQLSFDNSIGYLIGEAGAGMKEMFTFMNTARMGTSLQGVAHAELAYQNALIYARERGSMRSLSGPKAPEKPNDPLIVHPNVRQNLLYAKAIAEGGRAFLLDIGRMLDLQAASKDPKALDALEHEIGFYTPIAKACLTEWGLEAASRSQQVWGGHGYIRENGMEQIVRDARIATIYEGTTGVQALDFIGRKVFGRKSGGQAARYGTRINTCARKHLFASGMMGRCARELWLMQKQWRIGLMKIGLAAKKDMDVAGGASEPLLMYTGYMTLGFYWLRMAEAAQKAIKAGKDTDGFYQAKLDTCEYFFEQVMPRAEAHRRMMLAPQKFTKYNQEHWDK